MRPTLAVTSRTGHGVRLSATPADIEQVRRPVREREPDERLPPFRVVRVRSLDPRAVCAVERGEVPRLEGGPDLRVRLPFELREVLRVLRAGLRERVEELRGLPPLVPGEVPVPPAGRIVHHPIPTPERLHDLRAPREEVRDLVDRELAVAGLRDDVRPGHELLTRDAIRPPPSPSPPRGPRSPSESRGPTSTPLSSRSPRSAPRSSREGPTNSMRAEKRIALDRRNYRGKTINVNPSPA